MPKNLKTYAIISGISFVLGLGAMYYFLHPNVPGTQEVTTTQISGEKIEHTDFNYKGDAIRFRTESQGQGIISTSIPKSNIPEANMWVNCVDGLQVAATYQYGYTERKWSPSYSMMYLHRFGRLQIGGGPVFSQYSVGAQAAASWWF